METPVDLTSFTADQKLAFAKAAALAPTPVNTVDRSISAASLSAPANPITLPTYTPQPVINTPAPDFGVAAKQTAVTGSESDYKAALEQQGQFTARTQELEAASGVPGLAARLNELNALDVGYQSDLSNIASQNLQGTVAQQGTPTSEVGRQINLKDLNYNTVIAQQNVNIKRAVNNAVIASVQGQLANAQANIQRALDLEFKPLESKIKYLENVLSQNRASLSQAQQNQLQYQIDQQKQAYQEGQQTKKDIYAVMSEAAKNGADNATLAAIQNAQNPADAMRLAGNYLAPNQFKQATDANGNLVEYEVNAQGKVVGQKILSYKPKSGSDAPTVKTINGVDMQWNPSTGKWEQISTTEGTQSTLKLAQAKSTVDQLTNLTHQGGISTAVGTSILSRAPRGFFGVVGKIATVVGIPGLAKDAYNTLSGQQQNFIADVEQVRSQLTLDKLTQAKANGATFGALSDGERITLASAATKLGTWAVKDKSGNVIGYNASEKDFRKELDTIANFGKLDYIIKGGNPTDINVQVMNDGTLWSQNSDGTFTQLK